MPQNPELLALRLKEAAEMARLRAAQEAIKHTEPGEERESVRSLIDAGLEAVREAGRQITLWWLKQPKTFDEEDEMNFAEARLEVQEGLLDLGYSYPIQTSRERGKKVRVVYHDPSGEKHSAAVRFHEVEKWLDELPEPPEPDLDKLAKEQGKTIIDGGLVELPRNEEAKMSIEESVKNKEHLTDEEREALAPMMNGVIAYPNGKPTFVPLDEGEDPQEAKERMEAKVEEKELPPLEKEKSVEEVITYVEVNDKVAKLRAAEKSNDILLIQYLSRGGEVSARFIRVLFVSKDGKRFGVQDDQSRELRPGWYTASVLAIYPPAPQKTMRGYADLLSGYKKGSDKVCMLPYDGNVVVFNLPVWTEPDNVASLEASGLWIRK